MNSHMTLVKSVNKVNNSIRQSKLTAENTKRGSMTFAEMTTLQRIQQIRDWQTGSLTNSFLGSCTFATVLEADKPLPQSMNTRVCENNDWTVDAVQGDSGAFATQVTCRRNIKDMAALSDELIGSLAAILTKLSTRYDNLMMSAVALNIDWRQQVKGSQTLCAIVSPEGTRRSGLFGIQRFIGSDFTPEQTARRLRNLSDIHFSDLFPV